MTMTIKLAPSYLMSFGMSCLGTLFDRFLGRQGTGLELWQAYRRVRPSRNGIQVEEMNRTEDGGIGSCAGPSCGSP
jgi:hypothetical protein